MDMNFAQLFFQFKPMLAVLISYFLGSIPTSIIIGKLFFKIDIRTTGSGNTGATNALRTMGAKAGVTVLIIDILKGLSAVIVARFLMHDVGYENTVNLVVTISGLTAILGHIFSVFLKFKGGKGVATAAGVFAALMPINLLICLGLFITIVAISKYVSLGSVIAASVLFLMELLSQYLLEFPNPYQLILVGLVVALIIIRHRSNISRLLQGNENKISLGKSKSKEQ